MAAVELCSSWKCVDICQYHFGINFEFKKFTAFTLSVFVLVSSGCITKCHRLVA